MSETDINDGVDTIHPHGQHCGECRSTNVKVVQYDTFYKAVECGDCGEESYIPKRCAGGAWDRFRDFLNGKREGWMVGQS